VRRWGGWNSKSLRSVADREFFRRLHVVLVLSAGVGAVTGVAVAAFDEAVRTQIFDRVIDAPLAVVMVAPGVGLAIVGWFVRRTGTSPATTDAYVAAYHERGGALKERDLLSKLFASAVTLGFGGSLGYEGPAILTGGTVGSFAERRFTRRFRSDDAKVLMVAGAAAGVAAVFKAPLTGVVFALEVPYLQDVARRALLPAVVAASSGYLCFVALMGTAPVLASGGAAPFDVKDLVGGAAVGGVCGLLARLMSVVVAAAKSCAARYRLAAPVAGIALAALAFVSNQIFGEPLSTGAGYEAISWARAHEGSLLLVAALFAVRLAATSLTVAGGGVGGLFIPLVAQGALVGFFAQSVLHGANSGLLPTVGIASFLGAGYRTPLAGVAFVAEATGEPGFVVPALLASAVAQLVMGRRSLSPYQRVERGAPSLALTQLKVGEIMSPNPDTIQASMTIADAAVTMMKGQRRWAPVCEGAAYVGVVALADIAAVHSEESAKKRCIAVTRVDIGTASMEDSVAAVASQMRRAGVGALAIADGEQVVGVVTMSDVARIEQLLDRLAPETGGSAGR
jgi:CIC family chloride channel protein